MHLANSTGGKGHDGEVKGASIWSLFVAHQHLTSTRRAHNASAPAPVARHAKVLYLVKSLSSCSNTQQAREREARDSRARARGLRPVFMATSFAMTPIKYLLYDVDPKEGLNKQRRSGVFFLRRAMQMGRTLVLPRCRLLARHRHRVSNGAAADELSGNDIFVRWSSLYNMSMISTVHQVVE